MNNISNNSISSYELTHVKFSEINNKFRSSCLSVKQLNVNHLMNYVLLQSSNYSLKSNKFISVYEYKYVDETTYMSNSMLSQLVISVPTKFYLFNGIVFCYLVINNTNERFNRQTLILFNYESLCVSFYSDLTIYEKLLAIYEHALFEHRVNNLQVKSVVYSQNNNQPQQNS